jgi:hypothetical protein
MIKNIMPVKFTEFVKLCGQFGYKPVDQRRDKKPANIFSTHTRNGVKVEIKVTHNIPIYVAGHGLNEYKLDFLKSQLENKGMVVLARMAKFLKVQISDDVLDGFSLLTSMIEDIDELIQRQRASRFYQPEDGDNNFLFIAKTFRLMYELKPLGSPWSRLLIGDALDKLVYAGISIAGKVQQQTGKNPYREHAVPMDWITVKIFEMLEAGASDEDIVQMIKRNLKLVLIADQEQDTLDNKLGLRTTMPDGFKDGDDPLIRIKFGNIQM